MQKIRESQFEFIRVLAQFIIIVYHIYFFFIYPITNDPFHKAIWLPLHVGVILFILISGWFGIKPTIKSFAKLAIMMALLYFPLQLLWIYKTGVSSTLQLLTVPLFITWSPFWFMRTYVFLFLLAPLLNFYMDKASLRKKIYLLASLFFISHYAGTFGGDSTLTDGKNVIMFSFVYVLGRTMRDYQSVLKKITSKRLFVTYILYNVALVGIFSYPKIPFYNSFYNKIFFSYCSIGLLINATMLFMLLSRLKFRSNSINVIGGGSLTMYMVHSANIVLYALIAPITGIILENYVLSSGGWTAEIILFAEVACFAIVIMTCCVGIHYLCLPIAIKCSEGIERIVRKCI